MRRPFDRIPDLKIVQTAATSVGIGMSDLRTKVQNLKEELEFSEQNWVVAEFALETLERLTADLQ